MGARSSFWKRRAKKKREKQRKKKEREEEFDFDWRPESLIEDIHRIEENKKEIEKHFPEAVEEPDPLFETRLAIEMGEESESAEVDEKIKLRSPFDPPEERGSGPLSKEEKQQLRDEFFHPEPVPLKMQIEFWITEGHTTNEIMEMIGDEVDFTKPRVGWKRKGGERKTPVIKTRYETIKKQVEDIRLRMMGERGDYNPSLYDLETRLKLRHPAFKKKKEKEESES